MYSKPMLNGDEKNLIHICMENIFMREKDLHRVNVQLTSHRNIFMESNKTCTARYNKNNEM